MTVTTKEEVKVRGAELTDKIKTVIHEGNVSRIRLTAITASRNVDRSPGGVPHPRPPAV